MEYDFEFPADGRIAFEVESWFEPPSSRIKSLWEWHDPEEVELKIAICGAAGTGKKRLAKMLGEELGIPAINSVARTSFKHGAKLNKKSDWKDEFTIFLAQYYEQSEYDEFVTAGSVVDILAYCQYLSTEEDDYIITALANMCNTIAHNDYQVVFYCPPENKPRGDGVRSVDVKFQHEIDSLIRYWLGAFDLDFLPVQGSAPEKFDICMAYLREFGLLNYRD